jgi:hypothetical protein
VPATRSARPTTLVLVVAAGACALAGVGCGMVVEEPETAAQRTGTAAERTVPSRSQEGEGADARKGKNGSAGGPARTGTPPASERKRGCAFEPPPGRLAVDRIPVELDGVGCEDALRLVEVAAVGQPAGANLELTRDGFDCSPSTLAKGADTTYTCEDGDRSVTFHIVWSR